MSLNHEPEQTRKITLCHEPEPAHSFDWYIWYSMRTGIHHPAQQRHSKDLQVRDHSSGNRAEPQQVGSIGLTWKHLLGWLAPLGFLVQAAQLSGLSLQLSGGTVPWMHRRSGPSTIPPHIHIHTHNSQNALSGCTYSSSFLLLVLPSACDHAHDIMPAEFINNTKITYKLVRWLLK